MNRWLPCKRRIFIAKLKKLGFDGLFSGTRHQFMVFKSFRLSIPSNSEFSVPQLKMLIAEVELILNREITLKEWNFL